MSRFAASQIPKPSDEQAFERQCVVLWRGILGDPNVKRVGRRGQSQDGVDVVGRRNRVADHLVGVQCKLKGPNKRLTEDEIRDEVEQALGFKPPLREYFILTTAGDDVVAEALARELTLEQHAKGREIEIQVWGWGTIEEHVADDVDARKVFDPSYTPFIDKVGGQIAAMAAIQKDVAASNSAQNAEIVSLLKELTARGGPPSEVADETRRDALEAVLDAQIDDFRDVLNEGDPVTAQAGLERLWARVQTTASGRIRFRIRANIGACRLALDDDAGASDLLISAFDLAPEEPKATINKVLGLLLASDFAGARDLARAALAGGQEDETLGSYLIQASRALGDPVDPIAEIPASLRGEAEVQVAHVDYLRHRESAAWHDAAREVSQRFPDNPNAARLAAEAEIEAAIGQPDFQQRSQLSPAWRSRVEAAAGTLRSQWDEARSKAHRPRANLAGLCANLIVAVHALDDLKGAVAVAKQGLNLFPEDRELARYAAIVAMDAGEDETVTRVLPLLEAEPAGRVIAFRHFANNGEWADVQRLLPDALVHGPKEEAAVVAALGGVAELLAGEGDLEPGLQNLLDQVDEDPRAAVVIANAAANRDLEALAHKGLEVAKSLLTPDSHISRRLMVAQLAEQNGDWTAVADALEGWVDIDTDSRELRLLARALVNETPVRRRAARFFKSLPAELLDTPTYSQKVGLFHFNRGSLKQAEAALRRASQSGSLFATLVLFEALRRMGRDDAIPPIIATIDARAVAGTPGEKIAFARAMRAAGEPTEAIALAYDVLRAAPDDAEVALGYFALVIDDPSDRIIPGAPTVAVDTWVALKADDDTQADFLIVVDQARPSAGEAATDHPLVAPALGLAVGETFVVDNAVSGPRTWRVDAIKHKYLHAFHDVTEHYETRFPGAGGLWKITVRGDDIKPALDMVKRMAEGDERRADLYSNEHLPLNMVGARVAGSSIGFADYLRSRGRTIVTCVGIAQEQVAAAIAVQSAVERGVVLDTYTAWTAATLDALGILASLFGKLTLAQSALDEIRALRNRLDSGDRESLTMGYADGQFTRQIRSPEDIAAFLRAFDEQVEKILGACEIAPVDAPDQISPLDTLLLKTFGPHVLDAAYLAGDTLLVSEDQYFRSTVAQTHGVRGVWLQPIFLRARHDGLITRQDYARLVVGLAWRRHEHLSVDASTFLEIARLDTTETLSDFGAVVRNMGGPNANMISHVSVATAVLNGLWSDPGIPSLKAMRASSLVLEALIKDRNRPWAGWIAALRLDLSPDPAAYVEGWMRGRFLPRQPLRDADLALQSLEGVRLRAAIRRYGLVERHRFDVWKAVSG
ncbi:hypothetical protein [Brevundimonas sp.]|uniref:PIN domain-containing protein n=1 Tax=Brevundimonas sp. TaxID=1871086 RepID=UPI00262E1BE1|nr:hypothetical protein [Brevundimonas sp.]